VMRSLIHKYDFDASALLRIELSFSVPARRAETVVSTVDLLVARRAAKERVSVGARGPATSRGTAPTGRHAAKKKSSTSFLACSEAIQDLPDEYLVTPLGEGPGFTGPSGRERR